MQAVVGQLAAQHVGAFLGEEGEEVDEGNLVLFGEGLQRGVDFGHHVRFACQALVAVEGLVEGQEALQVELGVGRLAADALYGEAYEADDAVGGQVVGDVVDAGEQEELGGATGENLVQAVVDAHHVIAHDAAVADVLFVEAGVPVAAAFGEAVAQHHDVAGGDGGFVHELEETLVVVRGVGARGGIDGRGCYVGYQRAEAHHAMPVFGMHGVDEQDDGGVRVGVDDDGGAGVAGVPVGVGAEVIAVVGGVGGEVVPARCEIGRAHV